MAVKSRRAARTAKVDGANGAVPERDRISDVWGQRTPYAEDWPARVDEHLVATAVARRNPSKRGRAPELLDGRAVVWTGNVQFYGQIPKTTAMKTSGR